MKVDRPLRNFIRTIHYDRTYDVNDDGQKLLDLIDSFGGETKFVHHTHLKSEDHYLDIGFKILRSDVEAFLKEEKEIKWV